MGLPANLASTLLQQHVNSTLQGQATLAPLQVSQPIQVVTQSTNNVSQRPVQTQVIDKNNFAPNTFTVYRKESIKFEIVEIVLAVRYTPRRTFSVLSTSDNQFFLFTTSRIE